MAWTSRAERVRRARGVERLAARHRDDPLGPVDLPGPQRRRRRAAGRSTARRRRRRSRVERYAPRRASAARRCRRRARVLSAPHAQPSASAAASVLPREPRGDEARVERVARAGGVDRVDARRRPRARPRRRRPPAPLRAELHDDQRPCAASRRAAADVRPRPRAARLLRVGQQHVEALPRELPALGGSQPGSSDVVPAARAAIGGDVERRLQERRGDVDVARARPAARPGRPRRAKRASAPSAVRIARSPGARQPDADAGRLRPRAAPRSTSTPVGAARRDRPPEHVVADAARHRHPQPEPRRARRHDRARAAEHAATPSSTSCSRWPNAGTRSPPRRTRSALTSPTTSRSSSLTPAGGSASPVGVDQLVADGADRRRGRATPTRSGRASRRGRRARASPPAPPRTVSSTTFRNVRFSAAHCAGSAPTRVGCTPVRSTTHGTSTHAPAGRLSISPSLTHVAVDHLPAAR